MWIDLELKKPGTTLELLHMEYLESQPNGFRYTAFCDEYRGWKKKHGGLWMRQTRKGGEKMFVDYSGKRPKLYPSDGEPYAVEFFVAALGASCMTYAEATESQKTHDFIASHCRALSYFGGVPSAIIPYQLKIAVRVSDRDEPVITRAYSEFGAHFGTAIVPARPRKPRDKAVVEVSVQIAQRWILACLRNERHPDLASLNRRIRELLEALNDRPRKHLGGKTRRELFEKLERPYLKPLPAGPFTVSQWKRAKVAPDYHIEHGRHYYSVPHRFGGSEVHVRATSETVEVFVGLSRIASHKLSREEFGPSTVLEHMPTAHRIVRNGRVDLENWAATVGEATIQMVVL